MLILGTSILSSSIPLEATPVLDEFGANSLFGYSLRKLSGDPTSNPSTGEELCIRVRRDNDNAEQDISFSGGVLDTDALELFCEGGASAYVKIWYDQLAGSAGRTTHFAAASNTQQPPIVENGSVLTDPVTGLPCIRFSGERYLQYTETGGTYDDSSGWSTEEFTSLTSDYSVFFIGQSYRVTGNSYILQGGSGADNVVLFDDSVNYSIDSTNTAIDLSDDGFTNLYVWEIERDASNGLGLFKNNTDLITTTITKAGTFGIEDLGGTGASTRSFNGDVFELIGYSASQDERDGLFENLDEYYTITDYAHTPTTYATPFAARVAADGGSVESTSCLITDLTFLMNNPQPVTYSYLLDDYSGAAAAYSLRLLDSTYSGSAVRVRRASDNAEQDIGFVDNELDTSSLESFCSGTDGFVTTWYDQSGSNNATQTTAARQPKIVSSGTTITEGGEPTMEFDSNWLTTSYALPSTFSTFSVAKSNLARTYESLMGSDDSFNDWIWHLFRNDKFMLRPDSGSYYEGAVLGANQYSINAIYNGDLNANINGSSYISQSSVSLPSPFGNLQIGTVDTNPTYTLDGNVQEIVLYANDQTSNVSGIETNVNDFYTIY